MSYTSDILPDELIISRNKISEDWFLGFVCPRCGDATKVYVDGGFDLQTYITCECSSVRCCDKSKGQRIGYSFEFTIHRGIESASMLGLNDRPLNEK